MFNSLTPNRIMVFAYIRVSTEEQSYDGQRYEIEAWCKKSGLTVDRWVTESVSGTMNVEKRTLGRLLRRIKPGDSLICTEISRLGRNMMMVMSILNTCSQKDIRVHTIKDNFDISDSLNSKIIAFAFALAAEIERNLISQRTKEALAAKKMAGIKLGRPRGLSSKRKMFEAKLPQIEEFLSEDVPITEVAKWLGIHRNTLYIYLKDSGIERKTRRRTAV